MFFVVVARDKPDALAKRMETRPAHRAYGQRTDLAARLLMGVPMTADDGATMSGSLLVLEAPDRAAVEAYLSGDPYVKADIFASIEVNALHESFADWKQRLIG